MLDLLHFTVFSAVIMQISPPWGQSLLPLLPVLLLLLLEHNIKFLFHLSGLKEGQGLTVHKMDFIHTTTILAKVSGSTKMLSF